MNFKLTMYFAIIWKNKTISLKELELVNPQNIKEITNILITFDIDKPELLQTLWWVIKRGKVVEKDDLSKEIEWKKILWTKEKELWLKLKKEYWIKRFKTVDWLKTDIEVKKKWIEIIRFHQNLWVVKWYQDIKFYEKVEFDKPGRSMKMWMMPAKLTHIMINIGLQNSEFIVQKNSEPWIINSELKIYDPFAGSGTTGFIANYLWYDFIWSDINIEHLKINQDRWSKQNECNKKSFEIFQHDINDPIPEDKLTEETLIISEWRLWPIVTQMTRKSEVQKYQQEVRDLYREFIYKISNAKKRNNIKAVFTIPYYLKFENFLEKEIKSLCEYLKLNFDSVDEVYSREKQKVGRKIIIIK